VDATELDSRPPPPPAPDGSDFEEYPTQVQQSPFDAERHDDANTTMKHRRDVAGAIAPARGIRDTQVTPRPATGDSEATGRLAAAPLIRRTPPDARDVRDDQDTIIKSNASFPLPKRRHARKAGPSPDDTMKVDEGPAIEDPTQLMASRGPKAPRR
jgi:hypothetical protein